jgi:uncharacterized protein with HEPN domain
MQKDKARLQHIFDSVRKIEQFLEGMSFEQFQQDEKTVSAVLHELMVIGEAGAAVSEQFRESHPAIPFYEMIGMRNRIVHEYLDVRLKTVWETCKTDIPKLKETIEDALK